MKKQKGGVYTECPICLESIDGENNIRLRCGAGHFLHDECLGELIQTNLINNRTTTCPLCRENIDEPSGHVKLIYCYNDVQHISLQFHEEQTHQVNVSKLNEMLYQFCLYQLNSMSCGISRILY